MRLQEYWRLHRFFDCRNTLTYAHTNSRTLPNCDVSLGSLTVAMPEARDFVELLEPYLYRYVVYLINDNGSHPHCSANETSGGGRTDRMFTSQSTINGLYNAAYRLNRNLSHGMYNDLVSTFANLLSSNFCRKHKETDRQRACNRTSARTSANNLERGRQNQPWVLGTLLYGGVEKRERSVCFICVC